MCPATSSVSRGAVLLIALVLVGMSAGAETYQILEGALSTGETGESEALTGAFDASFFDPGDGAPPVETLLEVEDFAMRAGDRSFTPNPPIEYDGLTPYLFLEPDSISLDEDRSVLSQLRSGGEPVGSGEAEVTFRFLDFRFGPSAEGRAIGQLADSLLPRRLHLEGTLYEVDQTFRIGRGLCIVTYVPPPPPGGLVITVGGVRGEIAFSYDRLHIDYDRFRSVDPGRLDISDSGRLDLTDSGRLDINGSDSLYHDYGRFDIGAEETVEFVSPSGSGLVLNRVTGGSGSIIEGELREAGEVYVLTSSLDLGSVTADTTPSLEELGITAPDGATVLYDDVLGELNVTSEGDLFVEGTVIDLPGLTRVSITTSGSITITGTLTLPLDVALELEAGRDITVDGEIDAPGGVVASVPAPTPVPYCPLRLWPVFPTQQRMVGRFSLVASAARQVDIDVQPRRSSNRVPPGLLQWTPVAIFGSEDLDVRDIDETSLRLGPGEASPASGRGRRAIRRGYADRDRYLDLLARFDVRDTGIAYGDSEVCLVAETLAGETLEGCDAIETVPDGLRSLLRDAWSRRRSRGR